MRTYLSRVPVMVAGKPQIESKFGVRRVAPPSRERGTIMRSAKEENQLRHVKIKEKGSNIPDQLRHDGGNPNNTIEICGAARRRRV